MFDIQLQYFLDFFSYFIKNKEINTDNQSFITSSFKDDLLENRVTYPI
jgi:hypothetical protein